MKPPDLLNRLPSVSELLDKPPIRALTERWNRSVVAGGVRSFLDELRSDLRRRASEMSMPPVRELAERAARYVVSQQQSSLGIAINATGRIWGSGWRSCPLSDAALERAVAVGREFVAEGTSAAAPDPHNLEPLLCRLTGAGAAVVVHSYTGGLWLTLSALAADREVLAARSEIGELRAGEPLPAITAAANALLQEVGTTNRSSAEEYATAAGPRAAAILKLCPEDYRIVGDTSVAELEELVALARDRKLQLIHALGAAPLIDSPELIGGASRSVRASIEAGVDVALVRGDGFIGGPACGVLVGSREAMQRIKEHPLLSALKLDVLRSAALIATLESQEDSRGGHESLPVWDLANTPIENLRQRAERLAGQLAQMEAVASAVAIETRSPFSPALAADGGRPSYGVALTASEGDLASLDARLRSAPLPIVGRLEGERLVLDLRTVLPRQDKAVVDSLLGSMPAAGETSGNGAASGEPTRSEIRTP